MFLKCGPQHLLNHTNLRTNTYMEASKADKKVSSKYALKPLGNAPFWIRAAISRFPTCGTLTNSSWGISHTSFKFASVHSEDIFFSWTEENLP